MAQIIMEKESVNMEYSGEVLRYIREIGKVVGGGETIKSIKILVSHHFSDKKFSRAIFLCWRVLQKIKKKHSSSTSFD